MMTVDSIDITRTTSGVCECGSPHSIGREPTCHHEWVCKFGALTNPEIDPSRPIGHLTILLPETFDRLLLLGVKERNVRGCGYFSASKSDDGRRFVYFDEDHGRRFTWELFDASFPFGKQVLLGVWPD